MILSESSSPRKYLQFAYVAVMVAPVQSCRQAQRHAHSAALPQLRVAVLAPAQIQPAISEVTANVNVTANATQRIALTRFHPFSRISPADSVIKVGHSFMHHIFCLFGSCFYFERAEIERRAVPCSRMISISISTHSLRLQLVRRSIYRALAP